MRGKILSKIKIKCSAGPLTRSREEIVTYLDTDTTTNAQLFRDGGDLVVRRHLDAELAHTNHRTALFAFLPASLRLTTVRIHDSDTR